MNNREWIHNIISRKGDHKVPYSFSFSPAARRAVEEYYGGGDIKETLNFPIRTGSLVSIKPQYADPDVYGNSVTDEFGVVWSTNKIDRGSPIRPCLHEPSLAGYRFPDPSERYRFEGIGDWCRRNTENFTVLWVGDLWERAMFMRGMEELFLDIHIHPGFVHSLLRNLTDYLLETMKILFEKKLEFSSIGLSDDYGTQNAMMLSPSCWREFIKPYLSEIYTYAKTNGRNMFHHSCGNIVPIVGELIEMGLDILHPIQPESMDIDRLKREFGNDVTFSGGLNTQQLLPFGTESEIRAEVRRLKRDMGKGGGYILEPGLTVQADVPLKNIVAAIEEARA